MKLHTDAKDRANSIGTTSNDSQDGEDDGIDDSYERIKSISTLSNSISRGLSISVIREKTDKVNIDIIDARVVGHVRKRFALYTLTVTRTPGLDSDKAVIERRYSQFLKLYKELKKVFPDFMGDIEFPEKKLIGNLKDTLVRERCRLLQSFIRNIHENKEIKNSEIFKKFFYIESLQQGCQFICGGLFEQALNYLLNGLHLQQKLALDSTSEVIATLSNIVECYTSLKDYKKVVDYCNAALELIKDDTSNVYLVPLLQTLKNAYDQLGESSESTERRLKEIVHLNRIEVPDVRSLRELSAKRFAKQ
ncbi:sorting nexin-20-like [Dendronephthya gigantea]|uniref:sorting nexin-20-like n=1 Tax=Dendronephthya gigantea TaxID=151771 RepID=UPI00106ADE23|nr:sorting nexin-20-like [Dendronephthya gigantea]